VRKKEGWGDTTPTKHGPACRLGGKSSGIAAGHGEREREGKSGEKHTRRGEGKDGPEDTRHANAARGGRQILVGSGDCSVISSMVK